MEMKWTVVFYKGIADEIENKWPQGIRTKLSRIVLTLQTHGPEEMGMPYIKALGKGLFEMRAQGQEGNGRAIFCLAANKRICVLNAFIKKTQKTPAKELNLAIKRFKELK
jgi:phage-related protein